MLDIGFRSLLLLFFLLVKLMIQLHQRSFLDPRYVAARDAELFGNFPLRPLLAALLQAETANDNLFLPFVENVQVAVNFALLDFKLHLLYHFVGFGAQNIDQCNFVSFFIGANRIVKRDVLARFLKRSQMHQNFIFYAAGGECRQFRPFAGLEAFDRFDQADRSDGDQVLQVFAGIVELLEVVNMKRCRLHAE